MSYVVAVRRKASDVLPVVLFAIALSVLAAVMLGCAVNHQPVPQPKPHPIPPSLNNINKSLDVLVVVSILVIGASIAAFFFLPAISHSIAFTGAAGAGGVLGVSLFLKVTLWLIPWIAGGVLILSLAYLGLEAYKHFAKPPPA